MVVLNVLVSLANFVPCFIFILFVGSRTNSVRLFRSNFVPFFMFIGLRVDYTSILFFFVKVVCNASLVSLCFVSVSRRTS